MSTSTSSDRTSSGSTGSGGTTRTSASSPCRMPTVPAAGGVSSKSASGVQWVFCTSTTWRLVVVPPSEDAARPPSARPTRARIDRLPSGGNPRSGSR